MVKKKRHGDAEISAKLAEAEALAAQGRTQDDIAQALGISVMTLHRWRHSHLQRPDVGIFEPTYAEDVAAQLAALQLENTRLRRLVVDLLLEKARLEDDGISQGTKG